MKARHLFAILFALFELPIIASVIFGALITGLLCGLQAAAEHARAVVRVRQMPAQHMSDRPVARAAAG